MDAMAHANHLREWRERHGLTIEEVADLAGYSAAHLSRMERGERDVPPLARVRLARAVGARVRDLFDPTPAKAAS